MTDKPSQDLLGPKYSRNLFHIEYQNNIPILSSNDDIWKEGSDFYFCVFKSQSKC